MGSSSLSVSDWKTSYERLENALKELNVLHRQKKLANRAFKLYLTACHSICLIANAVMPFAAVCEVRNAGKINMNELMFFLVISNGFMDCFLYKLLDDCTSRFYLQFDNLQYSLWQCEWFAGDRKFRKLFLLSQRAVKQSLPLKPYSFYHINLHIFADGLAVSWNILSNLYQFLSRK